MSNDPALPVDVEEAIKDYGFEERQSDPEFRRLPDDARENLRAAIVTALAEAEKRERAACIEVLTKRIALLRGWEGEQRLIGSLMGEAHMREEAETLEHAVAWLRSRAGAPHAP